MMSPVAAAAGIAVKPTCINERAIAALNLHLQPRSIHVITTTAAACAHFSRMAGNVICHEEGALLPGVSHRTVAAYIQQRMQRNGESEFKGRNLAGWYLQQVRPGACLMLCCAVLHLLCPALQYCLMCCAAVLC
jgi:hypothetical protein